MKIYNEGTDYESIEYEISDLVGKILMKVHQANDRIVFTCEDNTEFLLHHVQDCCENVYVESITGDLNDLVGTPILVAEERTSNEDPADIVAWTEEDKRQNPEYTYYTEDSMTWTFYTIRTIKGTVDIRWYGTSNGYYSESVEFGKLS